MGDAFRAGWLLAVLAGGLVVQGCSGANGLDTRRMTTAAIAKAERDEKPVLIGFIETTAPDGKGAVGVEAQLHNSSGKAYRLVDLMVAGYDARGRVIAPFAGDKQLVRLRYKGPLKPRATSDTTRWAQVWLDKDVSCVEIRRINITYADGKKRRLGRSEARAALPEGLRKACRRA